MNLATILIKMKQFKIMPNKFSVFIIFLFILLLSFNSVQAAVATLPTQQNKDSINPLSMPSDGLPANGSVCGDGYCPTKYTCQKSFKQVLPPEDDGGYFDGDFFNQLWNDIKQYSKEFISGDEPNPIFKCIINKNIDLSTFNAETPLTPASIAKVGQTLDKANGMIDAAKSVQGLTPSQIQGLNNAQSSISSIGNKITSNPAFQKAGEYLSYVKTVQSFASIVPGLGGLFGSGGDGEVSKYFDKVSPGGRNVADPSKGAMDSGVPVNIVNTDALPVEIFGNLPLPVSLENPNVLSVKIIEDQQIQNDATASAQMEQAKQNVVNAVGTVGENIAESFQILNPTELNNMKVASAGKEFLDSVNGKLATDPLSDMTYYEELKKELSKDLFLSPGTNYLNGTSTPALDENVHRCSMYQTQYPLCFGEDAEVNFTCTMINSECSNIWEQVSAMKQDVAHHNAQTEKAQQVQDQATNNPYASKTENNNLNPFTAITITPGSEFETISNEIKKVRINSLTEGEPEDCFGFKAKNKGVVEDVLKPLVRKEVFQTVKTGDVFKDIGTTLEKTGENIAKSYIEGLKSSIECSLMSELKAFGAESLNSLTDSITKDLAFTDLESPFSDLTAPQFVLDLIDQGWIPSEYKVDLNSYLDKVGIDSNTLEPIVDASKRVSGATGDYNALLEDLNSGRNLQREVTNLKYLGETGNPNIITKFNDYYENNPNDYTSDDEIMLTAILARMEEIEAVSNTFDLDVFLNGKNVTYNRNDNTIEIILP